MSAMVDKKTIEIAKETIEIFDKLPSTIHNRCPYEGCNKLFQKPSRLKWHIRKHTGDRPFKCDFKNCDKSYTRSSHLKRHLSTHETVQKYVVCDVCHLSLKSRENLLRHYRRIHQDNNRLRCEECGVNFRKKTIYKDHMLAHKSETWTCDKCNKKFSAYSKYRRHQERHIIRYFCKEPGCQAGFDNFLQYRTHYSQHEGIDEKRQKQLKLRLEAHNRQRGILLPCPYDQCRNVYYYKYNLNYHIKTKHEGVQFVCDFCKKPYTTKRALANHICRFHLVENEVENMNNQHKKNKSPKNKNKKKTENTINLEEVNKDNERLQNNNIEEKFNEPEKKRRRKDAGKPKWSMTSKLCGMKLPPEMEKELLKHKSTLKFSDENFPDIESNVND